MRLSELIGLPVHDAGTRSVGNVIDVRLTVRDEPDDACPPPRLFGLVISPRTRSSYLGYERTGVNEPRVLAAVLRWRHRGTYLVLWEDVARIDYDGIGLRAGFSRYSAALQSD